jgi:aminoglycoside 6'-N-acetyltransferase I
VAVRRALEADRETCLALRRALAPGPLTVEHEAQIELALANRMQRSVFLCFGEAEEAIGMIEVVIRPYYPGVALAPVAALESLCVPAGGAGEVAARALIVAAEEWARTRGCRELALAVPVDDVGALAQRTSLGFVEIGRSVLMRRSIAAIAPPRSARPEAQSAVPRRPAKSPARARGYALKLVHVLVAIGGVVAIAGSDISSPDPTRGAWLPLLGAACAIYVLTVLVVWRYRSRTSESERADELFSPRDGERDDG